MALSINDALSHEIMLRTLMYSGPSGFSGSDYPLITTGTNDSDLMLFIYDGTRPTTQSSFENYFNSWYDQNGSHTLIEFKHNNNDAEFVSVTPESDGIIIGARTFQREQARLTGTATWFALVSSRSSTSLNEPSYILGDIGIIGSGADLEISDVNIISDESHVYGLDTDLIIRMPTPA